MQTPLFERSSSLAVVPAYNEAATVGDVVDALRVKTPQFDVVVVDDGSTDDTAALAQAAGARVLQLPFNLGIGGAVQAGFVYADEHGYDYMAQVDGDGQHDPGELDKLFAALDDEGEADMICGSRFKTPTATRRRSAAAPASTSSRSCCRASAPADHRPDLGLPALQPPGDRGVRARLPARLPGGRGGADAAPPSPARWTRCPCGCTRAAAACPRSASGKSAYYMIKVLLALFVGLGRRRAVPEPGEAAPVAADHGI